jgi:hypothetical protein
LTTWLRDQEKRSSLEHGKVFYQSKFAAASMGIRTAFAGEARKRTVGR